MLKVIGVVLLGLRFIFWVFENWILLFCWFFIVNFMVVFICWLLWFLMMVEIGFGLLKGGVICFRVCIIFIEIMLFKFGVFSKVVGLRFVLNSCFWWFVVFRLLGVIKFKRSCKEFWLKLLIIWVLVVVVKVLFGFIIELLLLVYF